MAVLGVALFRTSDEFQESDDVLVIGCLEGGYFVLKAAEPGWKAEREI